MCKAELLEKENIIDICKYNNYRCANCLYHISIEAIKENKKYRLVRGIGQYMNVRFEIQERYKYYENDKWVYSWYLIYHTSELENCIKVWNEKYNTID